MFFIADGVVVLVRLHAVIGGNDRLDVPVVVGVGAARGEQLLVVEPVVIRFVLHVVPGVVVRGMDHVHHCRITAVDVVPFLEYCPAQAVHDGAGLDPAGIDQHLFCLLLRSGTQGVQVLATGFITGGTRIRCDRFFGQPVERVIDIEDLHAFLQGQQHLAGQQRLLLQLAYAGVVEADRGDFHELYRHLQLPALALAVAVAVLVDGNGVVSIHGLDIFPGSTMLERRIRLVDVLQQGLLQFHRGAIAFKLQQRFRHDPVG